MIEITNVHQQHIAYVKGEAAEAVRLDHAFPDAPPEYAVLRCRRCCLEYSDPPVAPQEQWYRELYSGHDLYPSERWEYGVVRRGLTLDDVVVDYGCGDGNFLESLAGRARHLSGYDFSRTAVESATRRGVLAQWLDLNGDSSEIPVPHPATHVTAFHILEHLTRPEAVFLFAQALSGPTTRLWIAVPSDRRASRRYNEADLFDAPPHHLTRWTESSLRALGGRHGWALEQLQYEPLSRRTALWEATCRLPSFRRLNVSPRPLQWLARRLLAAGVWAKGGHRRLNASGFSMLARFRPLGSHE